MAIAEMPHGPTDTNVNIQAAFDAAPSNQPQAIVRSKESMHIPSSSFTFEKISDGRIIFDIAAENPQPPESLISYMQSEVVSNAKPRDSKPEKYNRDRSDQRTVHQLLYKTNSGEPLSATFVESPQGNPFWMAVTVRKQNIPRDQFTVEHTSEFMRDYFVNAPEVPETTSWNEFKDENRNNAPTQEMIFHLPDGTLESRVATLDGATDENGNTTILLQVSKFWPESAQYQQGSFFIK